MSLAQVEVRGTLQPDGTLRLDEKPNLPPGRVTVVLRQEAEVVLPPDDPFWQRMRAIWEAQKAAGHVPRTSDEIEREQREAREDWDRRQAAVEGSQEESRRLREPGGEAPK